MAEPSAAAHLEKAPSAGHTTEARKETPGILLVYPRLRAVEGLDTQSLFWKWTLLHYRDLLDVSVLQSEARFVLETRSIVPLASPSSSSESPWGNSRLYSHADKSKLCPYLYTSHVSDIGIFQRKEYMDDVTRCLDIEKTRKLGKGEVPVESGGVGLMVWDVVDVEFGVFEEVGERKEEGGDGGTGGGFTEALIESAKKKAIEGSNHSKSEGEKEDEREDEQKSKGFVVALHLPASFGDVGKVKEVRDEVVHRLSGRLHSTASVCGTVYRFASEDGQALNHPPISWVGEGSWLVLISVEVEVEGDVSGKGEVLDRETVESAVEGTAGVKLGLGTGEEEGYAHGVWKVDLLMI